MKEDHCTLFFEGSWSHCCKAHDIAYETQVDRTEADIELFNCVRESSPESLTSLVAALMFIGVSLFGSRNYIKARNKD